MRLEKIAADYLNTQTQAAEIPLDDVDRSDQFHFSSVQIKDRIVDALAPTARRILKVWCRARIAANLDKRITSAHLGYRFSRVTPPKWRGDGARIADVLVVGCSNGDAAIQRWLASRVDSVSGIEPALMNRTWAKTGPMLEARYGKRPIFKVGTAEKIPFDDACFDLITSYAVFEHVGNLAGSVAEGCRVLRPGGIMLHHFGPLYYSIGGDHCIGSYGPGTGFDHLLLPQDEYQRRIMDMDFFGALPYPQTFCNAWAVWNRFSFARVVDYLAAFEKHSELLTVHATILPEALEFRAQHPEQWKKLLDAGVAEQDLLVSALSVIAQKRA